MIKEAHGQYSEGKISYEEGKLRLFKVKIF
jgi:hypothetical protein